MKKSILVLLLLAIFSGSVVSCTPDNGDNGYQLNDKDKEPTRP